MDVATEGLVGLGEPWERKLGFILGLNKKISVESMEVEIVSFAGSLRSWKQQCWKAAVRGAKRQAAAMENTANITHDGSLLVLSQTGWRPEWGSVSQVWTSLIGCQSPALGGKCGGWWFWPPWSPGVERMSRFNLWFHYALKKTPPPCYFSSVMEGNNTTWLSFELCAESVGN